MIKNNVQNNTEEIFFEVSVVLKFDPLSAAAASGGGMK